MSQQFRQGYLIERQPNKIAAKYLMCLMFVEAMEKLGTKVVEAGWVFDPLKVVDSPLPTEGAYLLTYEAVERQSGIVLPGV